MATQPSAQQPRIPGLKQSSGLSLPAAGAAGGHHCTWLLYINELCPAQNLDSIFFSSLNTPTP